MTCKLILNNMKTENDIYQSTIFSIKYYFILELFWSLVDQYIGILQTNETNKTMIQYLPCWFRPVATLTTLVLMCQVIHSLLSNSKCNRKISNSNKNNIEETEKFKMKKLRALEKFYVRSTRERWVNTKDWVESMSIAIEVSLDEIPTPNEKKLSNIMTSNTPKKSFCVEFYSRVIWSGKGDKKINYSVGKQCLLAK